MKDAHPRRAGTLRGFAIFAPTLAAVLGCVRAYGSHRWNAGTREIRAGLDAAGEPVRPRTVDFGELKGLPAPVQRYFRLALEEGRPMVSGASVRHTGTFDTGQAGDQWRPFVSDQRVVTRRPGFDWNGRIAMVPGLPVRVHDAYVAGEGILNASIVGLFPVVDLRGGGAVAEGELMRFLAEAAWYPTALLPSQGVRWAAVNDRSARTTLTDGDNSVTLTFTFNERGLIEAVRAGARGRTVGGRIFPTPWRGRFWNYQEHDGMLVPVDGEVAWLLPEGEKPYWRGHLEEISYQPAR